MNNSITEENIQGLNPRTVRVRKALMKAAYKLASEKPVTDFTLTEVAKEADVSRPTLYKHFSDVPTLVAETAVYMISKKIEELDEKLKDAKGANFIMQYLTLYFQGVYDDRTFYLHVLSGPSNEPFMRLAVPGIIDEMHEGILIKQFPGAHEESKMFSEALVAGILWNVRNWLESDFTGQNSLENFTTQLGANLYLLSYVPDNVEEQIADFMYSM
ncbi:MAG: TetR/AcrR family transcriptional regulator [Coriobacteriales bacterium]|jgi:AcrR family transcriptional regulator